MTKSLFSSEYQIFISCLKSLREQKKITQQEIADKLKKPQSYVSKYESRERRLDVIETLQILQVLDVSPTVFFDNLKRLLSQKQGG